MKLFLQKNAKFLSAGGSAPKPPASGSWGLCPQTPKTAPHCEFLATRLKCHRDFESERRLDYAEKNQSQNGDFLQQSLM